MQLTTVQPLPRSSPASTALRDKASTTASGFTAVASSARTQPPQQQQESTFARMGSGMAIHFSPADPRVYLAATEDGPVHRRVHPRVRAGCLHTMLWCAYSGMLINGSTANTRGAENACTGVMCTYECQ